MKPSSSIVSASLRLSWRSSGSSRRSRYIATATGWLLLEEVAQLGFVGEPSSFERRRLISSASTRSRTAPPHPARRPMATLTPDRTSTAGRCQSARAPPCFRQRGHREPDRPARSADKQQLVGHDLVARREDGSEGRSDDVELGVGNAAPPRRPRPTRSARRAPRPRAVRPRSSPASVRRDHLRAGQRGADRDVAVSRGHVEYALPGPIPRFDEFVPESREGASRERGDPPRAHMARWRALKSRSLPLNMFASMSTSPEPFVVLG